MDLVSRIYYDTEKKIELNRKNDASGIQINTMKPKKKVIVRYWISLFELRVDGEATGIQKQIVRHMGGGKSATPAQPTDPSNHVFFLKGHPKKHFKPCYPK